LLWAEEPARSIGFGGWWYVFVGRPIFIALLLGWLWRLALLAVTLRRIAKLDLALVPTHADRSGGLGFVEHFPAAFSLVAFVIALVIASGWAHNAELHGLDVHTLYPAMAAALVVLVVLFLAPYLSFIVGAEDALVSARQGGTVGNRSAGRDPLRRRVGASDSAESAVGAAAQGHPLTSPRQASPAARRQRAVTWPDSIASGRAPPPEAASSAARG
jgi:hypothetical protein